MTNAAGNLVDLNGNQINGAFLPDYPGFPGFSTINAAQTLAYMADMQAELDAAAFASAPVRGAAGLTAACQALIGAAQRLAAHH